MGETRTKVLFVMPNFAGGGAERVALTLLAHVNRKVFAPQLAVLDGRGPLRSLLNGDIVLHEIGRPRLRRALPSLLALIRREKPAVVFASQGYLNIGLLAVRKLMPFGTKLAFRESSTPSLSLPHQTHPKVMAWAYRRFYPLADVIFCQHRLTEAEMVADFTVPQTRIATLPNPVPSAAIREKASPPERHPGVGTRFVAAGRLSREKGFDRLIQRFAELSSDCHLTIYGEGREQATLARLIAETGQTQRITLAGFTEALPAALAGADACVIPSHWEGLPNVALESLACGTPVIATPESGGIAELAEAVDPGSITIASWSDAGLSGFLEAMRRCPPRQAAVPAPSRLPARYELAAVIERFDQCLQRLVESFPTKASR